MVTRIKSKKMENRDSEGISQDWLIIKDLNKKIKKKELKKHILLWTVYGGDTNR